MGAYRERYLAGDCRKVWNELKALLQKDETYLLRNPDLYEEVRLISLETMRRVRANIETIRDMLLETEFVFVSMNDDETRYSARNLRKEPPIPDASALTANKLQEVKKYWSRFGEVPLTVAHFYEIVGGVDLIGFFPSWKDQLSIYESDPLFIYSLDSLLNYYQIMEKFSKTDNFIFQEKSIILAPTPLLKERISGSGTYDIEFCKSFCLDPMVRNLGIDLEIELKLSFLDYLRICFRWGGFFNLQFIEPPTDHTFEVIKKISKAMLPI